MANTSILAAFERMWQHTVAALGNKSDSDHTHDDRYYTETEIDTKLASKSDSTHNHDTVYDKKGSADSALASAKSYADSAATTAANKVKNDLLNGAGEAFDTLKELGDLIDDNTDAISALETVAAGKADKSHTHTIANVSGLQTALDGKAASSHGTHVSYSTTAPVMDGTAAVGTATTVARSDHKHPTDTSRASKTEFDSHNSDTTKHITATERTNWNAAKTHADSAHAPSNAEKNQNAFSNVKVGTTTIAADTTTDTLTLVGNNVAITPDATNSKVTFAVADGSTSAKGVVQLTNSTSSTSTTTAATPSSVKAAYDLANTAKTNAATAQSRADSAYTLAEGKVDSLSDLGITATATELNYMDGVKSNVQTQLDGKAASGHTHSEATTSAAGLMSASDKSKLNAISASADSVSFTQSLTSGTKVGTITINGTDTDLYAPTDTDTKVKQMVTTANSNFRLLLTPSFQTETTTAQTYFDSDVYLNPYYNRIYGADIDGNATGLDGLTATIDELNYMDGVTSSVQTQLNNKAAKTHDHGTNYVSTSSQTLTDTQKSNARSNISAAEKDHTHSAYALKTNTVLYDSLSMGRESGSSVGNCSTALGRNVVSDGPQSFASGSSATASGSTAHALGNNVTASANYSFATGYGTTASEYYAFAEGDSTTASGEASHAEGKNTIAAGKNQHVQGKYNVEDSNDKYAHIVGNGTSSNRSNAHTLDWNGNAWFKGNVYVGGTGQNDATALQVASVATMTTSEYEALETAGTTNANTLYMLTDAEDETIPVATTSVLGGVKSGGDIIVNSDGSVNLNSGVVGTNELAAGAVSRAKLAEDTLYSPNVAFNTDYTISLSDLGKTLVVDGSNAKTVSLGSEAASAFPVGAEIAVLRFGMGSATLRFSGTGLGVYLAPEITLRTTSATADRSVVLPDRFGMIALKKIWPNAWVITGNVEVVE